MVKIRKKTNPKAKNQKIFYGSLGIMLIVSLFTFQTWQRLQISELGRKIERADNILKQLKNYNQELRLERASLTANTRIINLAMSKLNLKILKPGQIIVLP